MDETATPKPLSWDELDELCPTIADLDKHFPTIGDLKEEATSDAN